MPSGRCLRLTGVHGSLSQLFLGKGRVTPSMGNSQSPITLTCMFLDCGFVASFFLYTHFKCTKQQSDAVMNKMNQLSDHKKVRFYLIREIFFLQQSKTTWQVQKQDNSFLIQCSSYCKYVKEQENESSHNLVLKFWTLFCFWLQTEYKICPAFRQQGGIFSHLQPFIPVEHRSIYFHK